MHFKTTKTLFEGVQRKRNTSLFICQFYFLQARQGKAECFIYSTDLLFYAPQKGRLTSLLKKRYLKKYCTKIILKLY